MLEEGLVIKTTGSWYYVKPETGKIVPCKIRGTFRMKEIRSTNPVAVGDRVLFRMQGEEENGMIEKILERRNYIIRKASNLSHEYQLLACNIDQALLMVSLSNPKTFLEFIDRFLVSAEAFRIPVYILFNKVDIYNEVEKIELKTLCSIYEKIGYSTLSMSLKTGEGLERVRNLMKEKVSVVAGNSGVGKSTLLNTLNPDLGIKTTEISGYHKTGRHTTTFAEMHFLPFGAKVIDTPGIKGYGMIDIEREELFHFFPEIFEASKSCKFHNCLHINEPDCAVRREVENQGISKSRYMSYIHLLDDFNKKYR